VSALCPFATGVTYSKLVVFLLVQVSHYSSEMAKTDGAPTAGSSTLKPTTHPPIVRSPQATFHQEGDLGLEEYQTLTALYQELCSLIPTSRNPSSAAIKHALRRCQANHDRLLDLLSAIGYGTAEKGNDQRNGVGHKMKRRLKRNEQERLQASYRDSVMLLKEVVIR
jgi:hypothetical protein